jgi:hypothetical protein
MFSARYGLSKSTGKWYGPAVALEMGLDIAFVLWLVIEAEQGSRMDGIAVQPVFGESSARLH